MLSVKHRTFLYCLSYDRWTEIPKQDHGLLPALSKAKQIQVTMLANGKKRAKRIRSKGPLWP